MYSIIIPFSQSFDEIWFTYSVPKNIENILKIWQVVLVPFWKKDIFWVVVNISENSDFDKEKIKEIKEIVYEEVFLYGYQIELIKYISKNYFSLAHNSLWLFFPKNLEWKILSKKFKFLGEQKDLKYLYQNEKFLNQNQQNVYEEILNSPLNKFLIYWVTWSWKTEIYIKLIKHYLDLWKQILFLVPEIILNDQIFERITKVFWSEVLVINSSVSDAKKTKYFESIYNNKAKIIIWTRSSIFYPYKDLWLIIMDEEHDNSYISDVTPRYKSLEVVNKISDLTNCKLVLWSATPNITDMYDALNWKYKLLNLFEEFE